VSRILQFGTGRFLRGFFDCIVPEAKSITVIQSRAGSGGAEFINQHPGGYHVWTRGKQYGQIVDRVNQVFSLDRALDANSRWSDVLRTGGAGDLQLIVSNTTEAGLTLDAADASLDDMEARPPHSFPARLLAILFHRYRTGQDGVTILPLELVENNATCLLSLVREQATLWPATAKPGFYEWLGTTNRWLNNLVDRIVVSVTDAPPWPGVDPLAVVAEPYRKLFVQDDAGPRDVLPQHEMIDWVPDLRPAFLRKVRILNGLHTAMVAHALPRGFETVRQVMDDADERGWLESLLQEEILPALAWRGIDASAFAADVLERFENPFFQHRLADIARGHSHKLKTRIQPTIDDFREAFGRMPAKLASCMDQPAA
jgi:tagaturonate reductase